MEPSSNKTHHLEDTSIESKNTNLDKCYSKEQGDVAGDPSNTKN